MESSPGSSMGVDAEELAESSLAFAARGEKNSPAIGD
jgi:hypothetical protein